MVSTASKKLKSLFGTYTIKSVHKRNYSQISEVLSNAIKRSYGPKVRLDLQLNPPVFLLIEGVLTSGQIKEILTSLKENISALGISLKIYPEILLQPHLDFKNIRRLDISFQSVDEGLHKNICEAILARYGDKLEHLAVWDLKIPNNSVLQVPHLSQLKSLALVNIYVKHDIVNTFVNSVNKENITHLSLCDIRLDIGQLDNFIFPKLQYLEIFGKISGESVLALIKCNKDTITKLKVKYVNFRHSDIGDIKIPRLQYLDFYNLSGDVALSLIKCNKDTITKLKVYDVNFRDIDIEDIKIPNLQYLELLLIPGDVALSLIKNNNDTLCEIRLNIFDFRNTSLPVVEMPRLKRLYLRDGDATSELKFFKAFGRNIEEFWIYDDQKETSIRKSREELNKLKKEAFALQ